MRFHFHLFNHIHAPDEMGQDLADEAAARAVALIEARTMAAESVMRGYLDRAHYIQVTDADNHELFRVTFGEVVVISN